jgi:hypothetical protein
MLHSNLTSSNPKEPVWDGLQLWLYGGLQLWMYDGLHLLPAWCTADFDPCSQVSRSSTGDDRRTLPLCFRWRQTLYQTVNRHGTRGHDSFVLILMLEICLRSEQGRAQTNLHFNMVMIWTFLTANLAERLNSIDFGISTGLINQNYLENSKRYYHM